MYPESERLAARERHLANKKASDLRKKDILEVVGITPKEEDEDEVLLHLFEWPGDPALADMSRGAVLGHGTAEQCEAMHLYRLMMEQRSWSSRVEALQNIMMIRKEIYRKRENDEAVQAG
jgi:hypothetical protein